MARIVKKKIKPKSRNPSYKGGTTFRTGPAAIHHGDRFYINHPIIDKITLLGGDSFDDEDKAIFTNYIYSSYKSQDEPSFPLEQHNFNNPSDQFRTRYRAHYKLHIPGTKEHVMFSMNPVNKNQKFFKLEFNPAKMRKHGIAFLKQWFSETIPHENFQSLLTTAKSVGKIHLAIDIIGIDIADMVLNYGDNTVSARWHGENGMPETYYANANAGKTTKEKRYLKKRAGEKYCVGESETDYPEEDIEENPEEFDEVPSIVKDKSSFESLVWYPRKMAVTRIEKEVETDRSFIDLVNLKPHFRNTKIYYARKLRPSEFPEEEHHWHLFLDSVRWRGFKNALKLIPEDLRPMYFRTFKYCLQNIFKQPYNDVGKWSELMQRAIDHTGLLDR